MKTGISSLVLALALGAAGLRSAQAYSIELTPLVPTQNAGVWNYGYTMTLTPQNAIDSQSFFTFYDVAALTSPTASFTSGATSDADWLIVPELTSSNWSGGFSSIPSGGGTIVLPDDNLVTNVRFQYVGSGLNSAAATVTLGEAHIFSTQPPSQTTLFYGARWTDGFSHVTNVNTDTPLGPGPAGGNPPEPASLGLLGAGLLGLLMRRRR